MIPAANSDKTGLDFGERAVRPDFMVGRGRKPAIDVGLPEGGTTKPSACDIPHTGQAPQLNALKKSAMPAPVTPPSRGAPYCRR